MLSSTVENMTALPFNFDKRLFIWLTISFIIATVIGTLTHEGGHYTVAKYFGYDAHINYMATRWTDTEEDKFLQSICKKYSKELETGEKFPELEKFNQVSATHRRHSLWIMLGGPFETMFTGTLGLSLCFSFRQSFHKTAKLSFVQWLLVFVSLFWLRQTANATVWVGQYILTGKLLQAGDEIYLAYRLHLPEWIPITVTALIGAAVLAIIIFKFVPLKQRVTFIASGLVGGIAGYILWLEWLGKYIMP